MIIDMTYLPQRILTCGSADDEVISTRDQKPQFGTAAENLGGTKKIRKITKSKILPCENRPTTR